MFKIKHTVIFIAISSLPLLIAYILKRKYKKLKEALENEEDNYYHQCIFINMNNFNCKQHLIDNKECGEYCSSTHLKTLLNFLSSAKESICICLYTFTLKQVHLELVKAHKNGVDVRIITDKVMMKTDISKFNFTKLQQRGIPYKVQPYEQCMMHHKFCLIDKDNRNAAKMFFGSVNLTGQGLVSNFENVVLTNNWNIIERYSEEFEELWESFHFFQF